MTHAPPPQSPPHRPSAAAYGLRLALAYGNTVLEETMVGPGGRVTVGQHQDCTFVLPGEARKAGRGRQVLVDRDTLQLLEGFEGRLHLQGQSATVAQLRANGQNTVKLAPEDWGVLYLADQSDVRIVVQRVRPEILPRLPRDTGERPLLMTTAITFLGFVVLLTVAFLQYDPERRRLKPPPVDDRFAKVMFNEPPEEPPEEEPEISDKDEDEEKERKKAGGDEGKFGDPKKKGPSNIPKNPQEARVNTGLVKELNNLDNTQVMGDLLGVAGQVNSAIGGLDEGELVVGGGNFGTGTKGAGLGGGGEGVGTIHGTGDVDVGGAGSANRKRKVKGTKGPKEKQVRVRTGRASVKGQLSKELIDREVRRHRAQIKFCYNKQLTRFPNLSGKVVLRWIIRMDGSVSGAKVKTSSLGNKDAESCMVRALQGWRFPKPQGGVVQVDYPFIFGTN